MSEAEAAPRPYQANAGTYERHQDEGSRQRGDQGQETHAPSMPAGSVRDDCEHVFVAVPSEEQLTCDKNGYGAQGKKR